MSTEVFNVNSLGKVLKNLCKHLVVIVVLNVQMYTNKSDLN